MVVVYLHIASNRMQGNSHCSVLAQLLGKLCKNRQNAHKIWVRTWVYDCHGVWRKDETIVKTVTGKKLQIGTERCARSRDERDACYWRTGAQLGFLMSLISSDMFTIQYCTDSIHQNLNPGYLGHSERTQDTTFIMIYRGSRNKLHTSRTLSVLKGHDSTLPWNPSLLRAQEVVAYYVCIFHASPTFSPCL